MSLYLIPVSEIAKGPPSHHRWAGKHCREMVLYNLMLPLTAACNIHLLIDENKKGKLMLRNTQNILLIVINKITIIFGYRKYLITAEKSDEGLLY